MYGVLIGSFLTTIQAYEYPAVPPLQFPVKVIGTPESESALTEDGDIVTEVTPGVPGRRIICEYPTRKSFWLLCPLLSVGVK
jgi:hypothetical protein